MSAPTSGPHPADRDAISEAVDDMEERVVGRPVDPPRSGDLGDDGDGEEADGSGRGTTSEPS